MSLTRKLFACVNNQGTAMGETVLTESQYNDARQRTIAEQAALCASDCTEINWQDVSENDAFNDDGTFRD